jgi:hypothetical protein
MGFIEYTLAGGGLLGFLFFTDMGRAALAKLKAATGFGIKAEEEDANTLLSRAELWDRLNKSFTDEEALKLMNQLWVYVGKEPAEEV